MKRQEFLGKVRLGSEYTCGFDGGYDDRGVCGASAIWHGWPGTPPDTKLDGVVFACENHFQVLTGKLWDYHHVAGSCGIPGTVWYSGTAQGQGCCKHELDFDNIDAAMVESEQGVSA